MDDEEEVLQRYGTPLEPLDEDEIPAKKPISIEDQIVTDENGKRRFHGAFTGGFSAGFWNTVGSLEGWKPTEFKSSRGEKAPQRAQQRPEDFMDDEDLGEFGIAPQRIQAQNDFKIESASSSRKRKFLQNQGISGPIPGLPVLAELLRPVEDKIAVRILKSMGWKPGQGIGPRLTSKQKKRTHERNKREEYVLRRYGGMDESENSVGEEMMAHEESSDDDDDENELTFAPDDYDSLVCTSKTNRFGLGYSGLSHDNSESAKPAHFNLFGPLEVLDKNNKKLSIRGQAFGVGALEEEDEDIYARDDLSKYDFSLGERKKTQKPQKHVQDRHIIEGFASAKQEVQYQAPFLVELPADFQPRNWAMRKSRFAPLAPEKAREIEVADTFKKAGLGRHDLNAAQRSAILEEQPVQEKAPKKRSLEELQAAQKARDERTKSLLERISAKSDNFTRGGIINSKGEEVASAENVVDKETTEVTQAVEQEKQSLLAKACSKTKHLGSTSIKNSNFKPFIANEGKQQRYEKFLAANLKDETEISAFLATIQPVELSAWNREMECREFIQARKMYKPLDGIMSERFVSETALAAEKPKSDVNDAEGSKKEDTKKIVVERSKEMWKPHALLCKRYNIAEPFGGNMEETDLRPARKAKLSIFEYMETSVNRKDTFQTPVIIPKHIEKPVAAVNNRSLGVEMKQPIHTMETKTAQEPTPEGKIAPTPAISNDAKHLKLPPKTELEKRVEESRDKPPSEKVELFRAIFEDSEDEDEAEAEAGTAQSTEKTDLDIEKLELPSTSKPSTAANLLRNISPPRGIFAALFSTKTAVQQSTVPVQDTSNTQQKHANVESTKIETKPEKITFKPRSERFLDTEDAYGPRLPTSASVKSESATSTTVDSRLLTLFEKHKSSAVLEDVWVERKVDVDSDSDSDSSSDSSSNDGSDAATAKQRNRKKKSKKPKKQVDKAREKKKAKKLKKKAKTKKKSKKKKNK